MRLRLGRARHLWPRERSGAARAGLAAIVAFALACGGGPPPTSPPTSPPVAATPPSAASEAPNGMVLAAVTSGWDDPRVTLSLWEKSGDWRRIGEPWEGVVGARGSAWGRGLRDAGLPGPTKQEGDGRAPAGIFALGDAYGYAPEPASGLPWHPVDGSWKCVDDPASSSYNRIVDGSVARDWGSAEEMLRKDHLYRYVVEVRQNADRAPGSGSCVFLHVWRRPGSPTAGCTAMDEADLVAVLGRLRPDARFVLLPADAWKELANSWDLPPAAP